MICPTSIQRRSLLACLGAVLCLPSMADAEGGHTIGASSVRQIYTSSTASGSEGPPVYRVKHLMDGRDWSAWGSSVTDGEGAWIEVQFNGVEYISGVDFVPGDARGKDKFAACGRPSKITIQAGSQSVSRRLKDERWRQKIRLVTPMYGRRLRISIDSIHGHSKSAGVCISELKLLAARGRLESLPHLRRRLDALRDDINAGRPIDAIEAEALSIGAPAAPALVRMLDVKRPGHTVQVLDLLGRLGARTTAGPIEDLYRNPKAPALVRDRALWALGALGQRTHLSAIKRWHQSARGGDRDLALDAWGRLGDPEALEAALVTLREGTTPSRRVAVSLMDEFPAKDVMAGLEPMLTGPPSDARDWALRALGHVQHAARTTHLMAALEGPATIQEAALEALTVTPAPESHRVIRGLAAAKSYSTRAAALAALGRLADRGDLSVIVAGTRDPVPVVAQRAATALKPFRSHPDAQRALHRLALSPVNTPAAEAAAHVLTEGGASESTLASLLASPHTRVRDAAGSALRQRGDAGRRALLKAAVDADAPLRRGALGALRQMAKVPVVDLIRATERAKPAVQVDLLSLLAELKDPAAATLAQRLSSPGRPLQVRQAAVVALGRCGNDVQAHGALIKALSDPSPMVQHAAVLALGTRRSPSAVKPLGELLNTSNQSLLRHAVVQALGNIGRSEALPYLSQAYTTYRDRRNEDRDLRAMIVLTASRLESRERMQLLIEAVGDRDPRVREAAERGLATPKRTMPTQQTATPKAPAAVAETR
ncbi:MAG: HEAT repeat domain-containing protein [Bradymonadia bacterium]